jgi:hypothetical protein
MNQVRTSTIVLFALAVLTGCQQDHQMIFTHPRFRSAPPRKSDQAGKLDPVSKLEIPRSKTLPPSNGVDVPIFDP